MSAEATPNFTVEWNEKSQDFLLSVGMPVTKLSDEIIEQITTCKGEYLPHKKMFLIPHAKLCTLLDECFDYFSEDSLVHIAKMLDKSNANKEELKMKEVAEEKVREKSVSKSKTSSHKKIEAPKSGKTSAELFHDKIKTSRFQEELEDESKNGRKKHRKDSEKNETDRRESGTMSRMEMGRKNETPIEFQDENTMKKQVLLDYVSELRHRMEKLEKYIKKM
jgi:hypothetical protein